MAVRRRQRVQCQSTFGTSSDKSSYTFPIDYFDREEILYADRDYAKSASQSTLRPNDPYATDFRSSASLTFNSPFL